MGFNSGFKWLSVETPPSYDWIRGLFLANCHDCREVFLKDIVICCLHLHVSCCSQHTDAVSRSNLLDLVSANLNGLHVPITTSFFGCLLLPCFFFRNLCSKYALLYFLSVLRVQTRLYGYSCC